jgi:hypothetical protein
VTILVTVGIWLLRFPPLILVGLFLGLLLLQYLLIRDANNGLARASSAEADYLIQRVEEATAMAGRTDIVVPTS